MKKYVRPSKNAMDRLDAMSGYVTTDDIATALRSLLDDDPGNLTPELVYDLMSRFPEHVPTIRMLTPPRVIAAIERHTLRKDRARKHDKARGLPVNPTGGVKRVFTPKRAPR